mmetsp:Transcript_18012/g.41268  ORF Transcript_18012/g.41268 Transcript_18012/m.41268 type:complete len:99 (-) Transcript_18012:37-333(-)
MDASEWTSPHRVGIFGAVLWPGETTRMLRSATRSFHAFFGRLTESRFFFVGGGDTTTTETTARAHIEHKDCSQKRKHVVSTVWIGRYTNILTIPKRKI